VEFLSLMKYLKAISDQPDYRECNRRAFKLEQVYKFNMDNYIHLYTGEDAFNDPDGSTEDTDTIILDGGRGTKSLPHSVN